MFVPYQGRGIWEKMLSQNTNIKRKYQRKSIFKVSAFHPREKKRCVNIIFLHAILKLWNSIKTIRTRQIVNNTIIFKFSFQCFYLLFCFVLCCLNVFLEISNNIYATHVKTNLMILVKLSASKNREFFSI